MRLLDILKLLLTLTLMSSVKGKGELKEKYYRAAVLEYVRFGDFTLPINDILQKNLKAYDTAVSTAAANGADILVFPEWGLCPHSKHNRSWVKDFAEDVPNPKTYVSNPCAQPELFHDRPILKTLSCMAHKNRIFVVANMVDAKQCSNRESCDANEIESCTENISECPEDGAYFHNTNVVFDREGTLIARYYKRHLFFEFDMNDPKQLEDIYFDTDFGKFTTFVCFDLMFKEAVDAVKNANVINVAYPTYWFDTAPFLHSAAAYQQAWSITNKVNLLAANVHNPGTGTLGSGIYSGSKGKLTYTNNPDGLSKLLISNVPRFVVNGDEALEDLNIKRFSIDGDSVVEIKEEEERYLKPTTCEMTFPGMANNNLTDYHCFQLDETVNTFVKLEGNEGAIKSCTNNFCCHISYEAISMDEDYFLGAFSGDFVAYGTMSYGMETCFLARCDSLDGTSCSNYVTESNTVFQRVDIQGNFTAEYVYPAAVDSGLLLTNKPQWNFDGKSKIIYNNLDKNALIFLGLNGRHYDRDKMLNA